MASNASARLDGGTLHLSGVLDRAAVVALWPQLPVRASITRLDLQQVTAVDSAGLALLAELQAGATQPPLGAPAGMAELCAAYRLTPSLDFNAFSAGS